MSNAAVIANLKAQLGEFRAPEKRRIAGIEFRKAEVTVMRSHATLSSWLIAQALAEKRTVALIGWSELCLIDATRTRHSIDQLICLPEGGLDAAAIAAEGFDLVIVRTGENLSRGTYHRFQSKIRGTNAVCILVHDTATGCYPLYEPRTLEISAGRRIRGLRIAIDMQHRGGGRREEVIATIGHISEPQDHKPQGNNPHQSPLHIVTDHAS
ncbi:MAG: hypothetical protein Q3972_08365 [Corynebacterium sp.]|nr:hypothetical protein [Corynebacterium sp.]